MTFLESGQARRCRATAKDGSRCRAYAISNSDRCFLHSGSEEVKEACRHGGANSRKKEHAPIVSIVPASFKRAGRRTDLTPELQDLIVLNIMNGCTVLGATRLADIPDSTYYLWKKRGEQGEEPYLSFIEACQKAEEQLKLTLIDAIRAKMGNDWRSADALLNRRFPETRTATEAIIQPVNINYHFPSAKPKAEASDPEVSK